LPRMVSHEQSTLDYRQKLDQALQGRVLPAVEAAVKDLQSQIVEAVAQLRQTSNTLAQENQKTALEAMATTSTGATKTVTDLATLTQETSLALDGVVKMVEEQLQNEHKQQQALLAAGAVTHPNARGLERIPPNLESVLKKARVIP